MAVTVAPESPLQDEIRELVRQLNTFLLTLSPPEACYHMTVEQMAEPATTLFVARDAEGALREVVSYSAPRGGHLFSMALKNGRDSFQFAGVALEAGVAVIPGEYFDPEAAQTSQFVVSLLDLAPEEIPEAVNHLQKAAAELEKLPPLQRPKPRPPQPPRPPKPQPQPQAARPSTQGGKPPQERPAGERGGRKRRRRRERVPNAPWIDTPAEDMPAPADTKKNGTPEGTSDGG